MAISSSSVATHLGCRRLGWTAAAISQPPIRKSDALLGAALQAPWVLALLLGLVLVPGHAQDQETAATLAAARDTEDLPVLDEVQVMAASEQVKQAPGVSVITGEDIERTPVTNDISEIVRRQPGVNLTGNTSSGARGNNRQIDIRGMGPENTLILIDGKPVLSRNAVRYGFGGERDTRGDSNWVPPEAIESIEVLRGPAAARYGSGAAGGVVNIRTKAATQQAFNVNVFTNVPQDSREGDTQRVNLLASGPINDMLAYRAYGNFNVTDNDQPGINGPDTQGGRSGTITSPAGREGVENRDLGLRFTLKASANHRFDLDATLSRQSNRYAGDTQSGTLPGDSPVLDLVGSETNRMTRSALAASHYGIYDFGTSDSYIQWENTRNKRLFDGAEGTIDTSDGAQWHTARLDTFSGKSQFDIPLRIGVDQVLTAGIDFRRELLDDLATISVSAQIPDGVDFGIANDRADRSPESSAYLIGLFLEDNIYFSDRLTLTPGLRLDYHEAFGSNASPSLNAFYDLTERFTLKAGIARAFKAPNLFQLNPNYVYYNTGVGCWGGSYQIMPCYILGNPDLDPETSINKEIGVAYQDEAGWSAGITYFHNDYQNRVVAGRTAYASIDGLPGRDGSIGPATTFYRWENSGPATVSGFEGNARVPITSRLVLSGNFTYMAKSEDDLGQPLSLLPEYTINAALDLRVTSKLELSLAATRYGEIEARSTNLTTGLPSTSTGDVLTTDRREAYTLLNLGLNYRVSQRLRVSAGVKNLTDRQLLRTGEGANTFNEPGRSYYLGLNAAF